MAKTTKVQEKAHDVLGASNCERWWNCPGSVELVAQAPKTKPGVYASEGTAAHELAAELVTAYLFDRKPTLGLGSKIKADGITFVVDEEMMNACTMYLDYIKDVIEKYHVPKDKVLVEYKVKISTPYGDRFGTADCIIVAPYQFLMVIDFKYGAGVMVDIEMNYQVLFYLLGGMLAIDLLDLMELEYVRGVVIQPRAPGGGIKEWEVDAGFVLTEWREQFDDAVARVKPGAERKAGDWCRWCPAKPFCPELRNVVQTTAQVVFDNVNVPALIPNKSLPAPHTLTPEMVARVLDNKALLEAWLDSVAAYGQGSAESGIEIPGYKLVAKRSNRAWIDEQQVVDEFGGDPAIELFTKKLKSPAQLEKIVGKEVVQKYCENPDKGVTLVPESDKRPAIQVSKDNPFEGFVIEVEPS